MCTSILTPSRSFTGVPAVPSSFVAEVMEILDLRGGINCSVEDMNRIFDLINLAVAYNGRLYGKL